MAREIGEIVRQIEKKSEAAFWPASKKDLAKLRKCGVPEHVLSCFRRKSESRFGPASKKDLAKLRRLGVPEKVLDFYRQYEPREIVMIADVRLYPISWILADCRDSLPSCYIVKHGYVVLGTTPYGDAYCYDVNTLDAEGYPVILLFSHEVDFKDAPKEEVEGFGKLVARNIMDFLEKFLDAKLDIEPY